MKGAVRRFVLRPLLCFAPALAAVPMHAASAQAPADSTFVLTTHAPDRSPSPYTGNGWLGARFDAHGTGPALTVRAGLYEHAPTDVPRITAVPAWNVVDVYDGENWLNTVPTAALHRYTQTLDMRRGIVTTTYDWTDGARRTSVAVEAFVSRATPELGAVRVRITPTVSGMMRVALSLAEWPAARRLPLAVATRYDTAWKAADTWYAGHVAVRSPAATFGADRGELSLAGSPVGRTTTVAEFAAVRWPRNMRGAHAEKIVGADSAAIVVTFDAVAGRTYTFDKLVGITTSLEGSDAASRAARVARAADTRGFDAVRAAHIAAWARLWRTDIEITGDAELQRIARALLFQLLCSADSATGMGIPPMGLSSGGYYGHVFWDSDTWMFPSLVLLHPEIARSLVDFRARTLDAARDNAHTNGYQGAMYPWEADEQGHETTPRFASQNASSEIHVNGDVALAQWQYYLTTGDSVWLARDGYPVLRSTADFWVSRATRDSTTGEYHIHNVVSVDEGLVGVSDDAYTNAVARRNLESAIAAARRLGETPRPEWSMVASRLHIAFDSTRRTYRTYEGAPDSTLGSVTALLSYPLGMPMDPIVKRANLRFAVERALTEEKGALMGQTLLAVVAAELGDRALVDTLLRPSYAGYLKGPFLLISETPRNNAVSFVTGAGGFLQQVIYGYTGLRIGDRGLETAFAPMLPSHVTRLVLRNIHARGRRYDVVVDARGRRMIPLTGP